MVGLVPLQFGLHQNQEEALFAGDWVGAENLSWEGHPHHVLHVGKVSLHGADSCQGR